MIPDHVQELLTRARDAVDECNDVVSEIAAVLSDSDVSRGTSGDWPGKLTVMERHGVGIFYSYMRYEWRANCVGCDWKATFPGPENDELRRVAGAWARWHESHPILDQAALDAQPRDSFITELTVAPPGDEKRVTVIPFAELEERAERAWRAGSSPRADAKWEDCFDAYRECWRNVVLTVLSP